ncbi:hypothetical protein FFLO_07188 [Filobasidium floriforme]|uniref:Uncharacterized protein n=1 Tax=Filobasidium floriforme TaxID=5210 RepID=A0A8K0NMB7_9TREE|nr:hypothetical protein FFLO_07188 [Filobasidium floriforme]
MRSEDGDERDLRERTFDSAEPEVGKGAWSREVKEEYQDEGLAPENWQELHAANEAGEATAEGAEGDGDAGSEQSGEAQGFGAGRLGRGWQMVWKDARGRVCREPENYKDLEDRFKPGYMEEAILKWVQPGERVEEAAARWEVEWRVLWAWFKEDHSKNVARDAGMTQNWEWQT